jgi:hypothetical protein
MINFKFVKASLSDLYLCGCVILGDVPRRTWLRPVKGGKADSRSQARNVDVGQQDGPFQHECYIEIM